MSCILYTYIMTNDTGFAPAVKDSLLTLACCKPKLRISANKNFKNKKKNSDKEVYILALCGKQLAKNCECGNKKYSMEDRMYAPVYFARVTDVIEMKDYYSRKNYNEKSLKYRADHAAYSVKNGVLIPADSTEKNPHGTSLNDKEVQTDMSGKYVIVSENYIYFGADCGKIKLEDIMKINSVALSAVLGKCCDIKNNIKGSGVRILKTIWNFEEIEELKEVLGFTNGSATKDPIFLNTEFNPLKTVKYNTNVKCSC